MKTLVHTESKKNKLTPGGCSSNYSSPDIVAENWKNASVSLVSRFPMV
jgi:hypothetical protein